MNHFLLNSDLFLLLLISYYKSPRPQLPIYYVNYVVGIGTMEYVMTYMYLICISKLFAHIKVCTVIKCKLDIVHPLAITVQTLLQFTKILLNKIKSFDSCF